MKNIKQYILLIACFLVAACDKGFDEMNVNPIALTNIDPALQLNSVIVNSAPVYNNLNYETTIVKQMITPFTGVGAGANFNQDNRTLSNTNWNLFYQQVIKDLVDGMAKVKDVPARSNLYNMMRIWKANAFMILTDTYGDVPYSEAGLNFLTGKSTPVYDSQEAIYNDILNELEKASIALDAAKPRVTNDLLYAGDVARWRKLGNSLLLRAAMRLSKINPTKASEFVKKAVAGGLMTANTDNAVILHNANYANPPGAALNGGQSAFFYLCDDFVKFLKANKDPRLAAMAVRYVGATSGAQQVETRANRDTTVQIGAPQGYDNTTIAPIARAQGLASLWDYSQLDRTRMAGLNAPSFMVTFAQTQLLLAEAAFRGWTTGDAKAFYTAGIKANMEQYAGYGASSAIPAAQITAFTTANTLTTGKELQQINEQYWVASFLNGPESWANFRRSDFPVLTPNTFPGKDLKTEAFIRRLTYTDAELNVNKTNVQAAIAKQGANTMDTRVWWDKK
jgi:Starch-binding associating with outer membrane